MDDFPYQAEYAKTGRSSCRGCKSPIAQGLLRIAVMVQNPRFDGKTPQWYHHMCFFSKQRPKSVDDIHKFESLRIEDQKIIQDKISNNSVVVPEKKGKGKKRAAAASNGALNDFNIEYAKSGRSICRGCENKIVKDEIRISKKDFESEIGRKYGGQDMWHHVSCFAKLRVELGYFAGGDILPGFNTLKKEDKAMALKELPAIKQEEPDVKKLKKEEDPINGFSPEQSKLYTEQTKRLYKIRDWLTQNLKKNQLTELLDKNGQKIPSGRDEILDRLADNMTFGALLRCEVCKRGQLIFEKYGYKCQGDLTEWSKCETLVKEPKRVPFKIPKEFKDEHSFLKKHKAVVEARVVKDAPPEIKKKDEDDVDAGPKVFREAAALSDMSFVILGKPERGKDELKKQIISLGGKVITKITDSVMAVFATEEEVEKMGARITEAKNAHVHVVPEDFIDEAKKNAGKIPQLISAKTLCDWGSDPNLRMPAKSSGSGNKSKSKSIYTKSVPSKVTLTLKGGTAVDPDSGLESCSHVYSENKEKYTVVLGQTDIQSKKNSYYKIQLLKSDSGKKYWVFRAWGRIGTTIGSNKLETFDSLHEAKLNFEEVYEERTGNDWQLRDKFVKMPGKYYPVDVDYSEDDPSANMNIVESDSKLALPVQNLIRLIFDVNAMKKVMLEFELDTEKMPLGKLSKRQIQQAFGVLSELQQLVNNAGERARFIDASNRFYTFIPHSFGIDDPPILNTHELVKQKLDMLDNLMELEIAYNLMKSTGSEKTVDSYYNQLETDIEVLNHETSEFKIIEEYVQNTHAATHSSYSLKIVDVFKVKRKGEEKRFKPFKKLPNHKLLWHGSRTTNFAGILAQGLRIAPPEAPVTGYMFGKGIYFADMVSKSANYCCTSPMSPTGLLLLCDVALGNEYGRTEAEYVEKLPKGKNSTKGIGRTAPDPTGSKQIDGIEVPCGKHKEVDLKTTRSGLLYNEYIVYDVAQVNVKYLLRLEFVYNY